MLYKETTEKILNASFEVHKALGSGFLESVYEAALATEFDLQNISFERQKKLDVFYKNRTVKSFYADYLVEGRVLVELKAIRTYTENEIAQVLNYLKGGGIEVGLLLNFGSSSLQWKRLINSKKEKSV
jgi:GxxExxY protein